MSFIELENLNLNNEKSIRLKAMIPAIRASRANVCISGPIGCGKSYLAKYLLGASSFEMVDVEQLSENFDFRTIFADETREAFLFENIENLSRAHQRSMFECIEARAEDSRVRILSTSKVSLKGLALRGVFREDLYYRLTVLNIELPALKEQLSEIGVLAKHLVTSFGYIHKKNNLALTADAIEKLSCWNWPGNIRELENVLERSVILSKGDQVTAAEIAIESIEEKANAENFSGLTLSEVEQRLILQTLQITEQNRTRAAEILGISIRTLRNKLNEYRQAGLV